MSTAPTLRVERSMLRDGVTHLGAVDEVGRGALCGPVSIGIVVISAATRTAPQGVRDSKLLTPEARETLAPKVRRWAVDSAVGHALASEIDEVGIMAAMRLAGQRALGALDVRPDALLLDGNHNYLTPPVQEGLFGEVSAMVDEVEVPPVTTMIKADMKCAAVAAASILAKTSRDALMVALHEEYPDYAWADNKGYSAPAHIAALERLGPSAYHRRSWSLPGTSPVLALES